MAGNQRFRRILDEGKCIGCGLCVSMFPDKLEMKLAATGYLRPAARADHSAGETDAICDVCPGVVQAELPEDLVEGDMVVDEVWGPYARIGRAWAADPEIRGRTAAGQPAARRRVGRAPYAASVSVTPTCSVMITLLSSLTRA